MQERDPKKYKLLNEKYKTILRDISKISIRREYNGGRFH